MTSPTPVPGMDQWSSTLPLDEDPLILSDMILSSLHFDLAKRLGKNFAKRQGVDEELYQAEAAYQMVLIHRGMYTGVTTEKRLIRKVYKELWKYYYADRAVAPKSTSTIWRGNLPKANEDATMVMVGDDAISLMELIDEVTTEAREKEYIRLVMEGKSIDEIKVALDIGDRVLADIRACIAKRVKECKHSSPSGTLTRLELASTQND